MSRGTTLQRMEEDVKQSKTAVNANAAAGESALPKEGSNPSGVSTPGNTPPFEDLGGPTPENYKVDNDSAKLKTPGGSLKQVRDVVNKGAKPGDQAMPTAKKFKEEEEVSGDVVAEDEVTTDEVVSEAEATEEINIEDDVNALLGGEELTEEFKAKAKTIFEAAINSKISEIRATLEEEYSEKLAEEVAEEKEALTERVDSYLEYVSDEWMEENQLAIEHGLKTELTESFLTGMRSLFEENYVSIPEDKYDVLESMVEKLDDMESKLNEQIEKNIHLNGRLAESVADGILESVSGGLAATQKEKLASLAESVEFESEATYRDKLETLKESYFTSTSTARKTETLTEGEAAAPEVHSGSMASYLKTLSAFK
jgi:outer membrane protein OmpA-like peptidoglycan-associated protein